MPRASLNLAHSDDPPEQSDDERKTLAERHAELRKRLEEQQRNLAARPEEVPRWLRQLENLTDAEIKRLQAEQAQVYAKLVKRWDLVRGKDIAEIYASMHGVPVERALEYLKRSILRDEFGPYPRRRVFWLPEPPSRIDAKPHPLKVTNANIAHVRTPINIADLYVPRAPAAAWLRANGVPQIPSWLTNAAVIEGGGVLAALELPGPTPQPGQQNDTMDAAEAAWAETVLEVGLPDAAGEGTSLRELREAELAAAETPETEQQERTALQKIRLPDEEIHSLILAAIHEALPKTINRKMAREAVQRQRPKARQDDIDNCFQSPRYDAMVKRRKGSR